LIHILARYLKVFFFFFGQRKLTDQYKFIKKKLSLIVTTLITRAKATIAITNQVLDLVSYVLLHKRKGATLPPLHWHHHEHVATMIGALPLPLPSPELGLDSNTKERRWVGPSLLLLLLSVCVDRTRIPSKNHFPEPNQHIVTFVHPIFCWLCRLWAESSHQCRILR
jgi:hypothetical protein